MTGSPTTKQLPNQDLVYDLAVSPDFARDGVCFAARTSGLYRSDDGGHTWRAMYDTLDLSKPLLTTAAVVSPNFADDHLLVAGVQGGILRTNDNGKNWRAMLFPPPAPLITTMVASPNFAQDGVILAGTAEDGIFCSTDRGLQWGAWNFGLLDLSVFSIAMSPNFKDDESVFAGTETGVFRSTNGGRSWRAVPFPTEAAPVISLMISSDGNAYAGTETHGLFCSADRGQTWERQGPSAIPDVVNAIVPHSPGRPENVTLLLDSKILTSPDGGKTWSLWADIGQPATAIAASAAAQTLLVGTLEGHILLIQERSGA